MKQALRVFTLFFAEELAKRRQEVDVLAQLKVHPEMGDEGREVCSKMHTAMKDDNRYLIEALSCHAQWFDPMYLEMVLHGYKKWTLPKAFALLVQFLKKDYQHELARAFGKIGYMRALGVPTPKCTVVAMKACIKEENANLFNCMGQALVGGWIANQIAAIPGAPQGIGQQLNDARKTGEVPEVLIRLADHFEKLGI